LRHLVETSQRNSQPLGLAARCLRCRYSDHIEPGADAFRQKLDKMLGGRAAAETEPHAGSHEFEGSRGGCAFLGLDVHRDQNRLGLTARTGSI